MHACVFYPPPPPSRRPIIGLPRVIWTQCEESTLADVSGRVVALRTGVGSAAERAVRDSFKAGAVATAGELASASSAASSDSAVLADGVAMIEKTIASLLPVATSTASADIKALLTSLQGAFCVRSLRAC